MVDEGAPLGEIYNAGPENPTSIRDVVKFCGEALGMSFGTSLRDHWRPFGVMENIGWIAKRLETIWVGHPK